MNVMSEYQLPEDFNKDETPEEYVENRLADINQNKGFNYVQVHPEFTDIEKSRNVQKINLLCDEIEADLPNIERLIKKIKNHISSITEQTKVAAVYLLFGRAYSNLQTALLVCRNGKNMEAMELSRSGKEALDLLMLFLEDKNKPLLEKWFKGKIIGNVDAREFQHEHLNKELAETFGNEEQPIKEMLSSGYKIMSTYTHSGYAGLLDTVDVYRLDFDFHKQSGYHYSIDNFHIVQDLRNKIILQLKNTFLHLKDGEVFKEADSLFKSHDSGMTVEDMKRVISRHKK